MVAAKCSVSFETVRAHIKNIYSKLPIASMAEAVPKPFMKKMVYTTKGTIFYK
jgi:ATP/maltotriose-dependent transcriptional regulator MalT